MTSSHRSGLGGPAISPVTPPVGLQLDVPVRHVLPVAVGVEHLGLLAVALPEEGLLSIGMTRTPSRAIGRSAQRKEEGRRYEPARK